MSRVDLKVVLLGKENCGKSSLVERFIYDRFKGDIPYQNTIGAAFGAKKIEANGDTITIGLWDTAGSERYESMSRIYYRDAKAAIICYDLTDDVSYNRARFWVDELKKHEKDCRIYLCGTKNDLIKEDRRLRKIDYHSTTDFADEINSEVFETSSKTSDGVRELFDKIAEDFVRNRVQNVGSGLDRLSLEVASYDRKQMCC